MSTSALRVVYRPVTHDLADQSMRLGDPEHVDLVEFEEIVDGGQRITGTTPDGDDIVVWVESGDVRSRHPGGDAYTDRLGTLEEFKGVTVSA